MEAVTLLSRVLKMDETELKDKLENNSSEIVSKVDNMQVYTKEEMQTKLLNHTLSLGFSGLPDKLKQEAKESLKDELMPAARGAAFEQKEKEIASKYGIETWERMDDLVKQVHEKGKVGDNELHTQNAKLRETIEKKETELQQRIKEVTEGYTKKMADFELNNRLSIYENQFQITDEDDTRRKEKEKKHLDFIKYEFNSLYDIVTSDDGALVVQTKDGTVLRDDNLHHPLKVSAVLDQLVKASAIPLKESRQIDGRGGNGGSSGGENPNLYKGVDMSKFKSFDEFLASEPGKGIKVGTNEANEAYEKFMKAKEVV